MANPLGSDGGKLIVQVPYALEAQVHGKATSTANAPAGSLDASFRFSAELSANLDSSKSRLFYAALRADQG